MVILILYLLAVLLLLIFLIFMSIYTLSLIYSSLKGSPYVATRSRRVEEILGSADLKKGKLFIELGSGDGRVVRMAAKKYGIKGIGVDVNPLLIFWSKILGKKNIDFRTENIFTADLSKADYVYIFLMPKLIEELAKKMDRELKKGAVVISHGFPVKGWEKQLFRKLDVVPFPTYFYKIK
ncbi:class I SAM-dependent methyltransferase [Patescibacteria group bacterium]|nr:class I SAM-dependent methyltransferase [Patescibacteria group bacterium]